MNSLPNPFQSAVEREIVADSAAGPCLTDPTDPAADQFESRFVLDVEAFLKKIAPDIEPDPSPLFLAAPSLSYLRATEMIPMLEVLAGR